ncbi:hypothetical protein UA08_04579 [Talaromyces atroroseus]|uniref:ethanolamine kinase n=1 Tax=Talaromyces atroroseus TaxID=1441469 RepID=A0A225ASJ7_TALAT|nr:hypothetical protein UA08_04579 [Talaromyces atroroseus]OKL60248.1 hypothetical protein UA08_04579 [Talaromyces atroroseus]
MSGDSLRYIPLTYDHADSQASALRLVLSIKPDWEGSGNNIEFVRFTDGITNTLLKIINRKPGLTDEQIDNEAILMRAYGNHTEILIDRERETRSHTLLAQHGLAPPLLARFKNGLLYCFIRGHVTSPADLTKPSVWRGVARRLAQWHASLPITQSNESSQFSDSAEESPTEDCCDLAKPNGASKAQPETNITPIRPRQAGPNMWTVLQKWILALPALTEEQRLRQRSLQGELERLVDELDDGSGIGDNGLVFAHCDLLSANVIVQPQTATNGHANGHEHSKEVQFIDYEYATPSPAAFDIANHFAEWGGYDCDYNMLPTRSVRRDFLTEYVKSFSQHGGKGIDANKEQHEIVEKLFQDVDRFRGIPGFYWGVWALIQATISQIDFDYASYAEVRLGEYWAWRRESDAGYSMDAKEEKPLRERRWAQEA